MFPKHIPGTKNTPRKIELSAIGCRGVPETIGTAARDVRLISAGGNTSETHSPIRAHRRAVHDFIAFCSRPISR
jgi:hypothetical protein